MRALDSLPSDEPVRDYFPFAYSPDMELPGYARMRAEGQALHQAVWSGVSYLRKYRQARRSAPPEEIRYFDDQRLLLRWLGRGREEGVRLGLVGDLMWMRDGWDTFLAPEPLAYLNGHAVVLGNLESPISPRFPVPSFWPDYFTYNSDPGLITSFRRPDGPNTFSALATANNHSLDRGDAGLTDTLDFLDAQSILHAGVRRQASDRAWALFEKDGVRFGFYAACWGLNNPEAIRSSQLHIEVLQGLTPRVRHPIDLGAVRAALKEMEAAGVQFKIVYLHWGYEFELYPCPDVMRVGRDIVAAGADLVMGSHPHVVQPVEVCFVNGYEKRYLNQGADLPALAERTGCLVQDEASGPRKGLIVYSLGNFATTMYTDLCRTGMVFSIRLVRDSQSQRMDWVRPEVQLVYNIPRDPQTRQRRLVLLESYLRECERRGDRAASLRSTAAFLHRHLFGSV